MNRNLKINLDVIREEEEEAHKADGLCEDGVRVGSLLVSSEGLSSSQGASYVLSLQDLVLDSEENGGFLGHGSSGSVRRATHRRSGELIALKEIKVTSQAHLNEIRRELETLHASDVPLSSRLVDFYGAFSHDGSVFIAVECLDGSLDLLPKPVPLSVLVRITHSILLGLFYLHRTRHLIHRDLKPNNVLFNKSTGAIKISDFGVSSNLECTKGDANSFVGTVTYMSPERLKGELYSYSADIWSLGLVVAELALGANPFAALRGGSTEARFWALLQHLSHEGPSLELPDTLDAELRDFISRCVEKKPDARPTVTQLLQHPFITRYCGPVEVENIQQNEKALSAQDEEVILPWLQAVCQPSGGKLPANVAHFTSDRSSNSIKKGPSQDGVSPDAAHNETLTQTRTAEPSVNLDDELDKLLF